MPVNSAGVTTARDKLTIHWTQDEVMYTTGDFASLPTETARNKYRLGDDTRDWKVTLAQNDLMNTGITQERVHPILYRPFDTRFTYYTGNSRGFLCMPRREVMQHMLSGNNIGLITCRQQARARDAWQLYGVSDSIIESCAISNTTREINSLFPLYIYPPVQGLEASGMREANLSPEFTADMAERLGLRFIPDGKGDLDETFGPVDALHYIYAVLHSSAYRERYDQFLRADFPRVPLTGDADVYRVLVRLGEQLTNTHLLRSLPSSTISFPIPSGSGNIVETAHPKYYAPGDTPDGETAPVVRGRVYISKSKLRPVKQGQYFDGVTPEVWESRIGGYRPTEKWLKDRKGRAQFRRHQALPAHRRRPSRDDTPYRSDR